MYHFSGVSDEDAAFADGILASTRDYSRSSRRPPRPPSSTPKSPRPFTPIAELTGAKSPSTSGHHSVGSKFSVSSPSASPSSVGKSPSPNNIDQQLHQVCTLTTAAKSKSEEAIAKLRREISALRERFATRQKDWAEVRKLTMS